MRGIESTGSNKALNDLRIHRFVELFVSCVLVFLLQCPAFSAQVRIKDLVKVEGVSSNKLIGYGLVVGLSGTGDRLKGITDVTVANLLKTLGSVAVNAGTIRTQNAAAVVVTAEMPAFAKSGDSIDVTVSALGDASSLEGGTLLMTPLRAGDGNVYGMAQGALSIGGFNIRGGGRERVQRNHPLVGRIPDGALLHRGVETPIGTEQNIRLVLRDPDFTTASRIAGQITTKFGAGTARAEDAATIDVTVPESYQSDRVTFLAMIGQLSVTPDEVARVVINERTGTVVMGKDVKISPVAVSHGALSVVISTTPEYPPGPSLVPPAAEQKTQVQVEEEKRKVIYLKGGATLKDVVDALNVIGAGPRDLIAILQALKRAGALQAELEIL